MSYFRRGRHRTRGKHSIRVADLNPSTVPGMTFATYAPIERWLRLPGAHLTMPVEDVFAAREEMWAAR